jgi:hypothetical protein
MEDQKTGSDQHLPKETSYSAVSIAKTKAWKGDKFILAAVGLLSIVSFVSLRKWENKKR